MKTFDNLYFKGTFREYQQRVLDNSAKFLNDGKINIVAAPGSGKTILGLEIIRRLNNSCIILSPTTTIRHQWGERFLESFLNNDDKIEDYFSYDLNKITLLNSITYQALYSAIKRIKVDSEDEVIDYSNIDLFNLIKDNKIKTICLDEAHHLQNEWQKALDTFIRGLDKDIKIISLTATPPYDANQYEWERYISVSGEIDDEIFVPELVKEGTLCPHQDYIYFNYPTEDETESFKNHRLHVYQAINEVSKLSFINKIENRIISLYHSNPDYIYANYQGVVALLIYLDDSGLKIHNSFFRKLTHSKSIPKLNLVLAERAFQFIIDDIELFIEQEKDEIKMILKSYSLIDRQRVRLDLTNKLKRSLISSIGKLTSISKIVETEFALLQDDLRMLVLTDYIKKGSIHLIGTGTKINNISVISIFEQIRQQNHKIPIGVLSGSLVILPYAIKDELLTTYHQSKIRVEPLGATNYAIYHFKGSNKNKVAIVSKLFEDGLIKVIVGTKSLLGEGWDSPCINSLILASFVGSFMLSNQMRGRAIRTFKGNPNKTANIWHLATIEPDYLFEDNLVKKTAMKLNKEQAIIVSSDYENLCRRFDCFVGPNYETNEIESGIERITYIKPPFDQKNFDLINKLMLDKSTDRDELNKIWAESLINSNKIVMENRIPRELKVPSFTFYNAAIYFLAFSIESSGLIALNRVLSNSFINEKLSLFMISMILVYLVFGLYLITKISSFILKHFNPKKSLHSFGNAILKTLIEMGKVSEGVMVKTKADRNGIFTQIYLEHASIYEQNIFNTAITELLSPIDNPRYIIIKKNLFNQLSYKYSFACPSIIGQNSESVDILTKHLTKSFQDNLIVYTRSEQGRKMLVKCRKKSYITYNYKHFNKRQRLTKWD